MSEQIRNTAEHADDTDPAVSSWDSLSDVPFNDVETQERSRAELEQQTIDKLNRNSQAKKTFRKIILGVVLAAVVVGGASSALNSGERSNESRPINIGEVTEITGAFIDKNSDDLVWFETVTDNTDLSMELNQENFDQNQSYDNTLRGDIAKVEMSWWEGRGSMYRATDKDADGKWDAVQKMDADTGELSTIDLNNLENVNAESLTMSSAEQLFS